MVHVSIPMQPKRVCRDKRFSDSSEYPPSTSSGNYTVCIVRFSFFFRSVTFPRYIHVMCQYHILELPALRLACIVQALLNMRCYFQENDITLESSDQGCTSSSLFEVGKFVYILIYSCETANISKQQIFKPVFYAHVHTHMCTDMHHRYAHHLLLLPSSLER